MGRIQFLSAHGNDIIAIPGSLQHIAGATANSSQPIFNGSSGALIPPVGVTAASVMSSCKSQKV